MKRFNGNSSNKPEKKVDEQVNDLLKAGISCPSSIISRRSFMNLALGTAAATFGMMSFGGLTGCRESKARTDIIAGEVNKYEIDYDLSPVSWDNPLASSVMSQEESESDRQDEWEENDPEYSDDPTTDGDTSQASYDENETTGRNASDGGEDASEEGEGVEGSGGSESGNKRTQQGYTSDTNADEKDGDGDPDSDSNGETDPESTYNPGTSNSGGGSGGNKGQTYNGGTYEDIPNVSKIAAVGPYATIVQAIGGPGALAACNADWYNGLPTTAFSNGAELADTVKISEWGDGTRTASDSVLQQIIDSGAEIVLTSDSYPCITTDDQAAVLHDAGISVVVMPIVGTTETTDDDIKTCVSLIGTMLKDLPEQSDKMTPLGRANAWKTLHDKALNDTVSANGGYTMHMGSGGYVYGPYKYQGAHLEATPTGSTSTNRKYSFYIDSWAQPKTDTAPLWLLDHRAGGDKYAWPFSREDTSATQDYFDGLYYANISSGAGCGKPFSGLNNQSVFALFDYYFQCAGVDDRDFQTRGSLNAEYSTVPGLSGESYLSTQGTHITPWLRSYFDTSVAEVAGVNTYEVLSFEMSSWKTYVLGDSEFPAVIVRDESFVEHLSASLRSTDLANKAVGIYDYGKPFDCYVMPRGLDGSWTDGTFESFLMAPWLYSMFWCSEGDVRKTLRECDPYVVDFYTKFYRCEAEGILDAGAEGVTTVATNGSLERKYGGYAKAVSLSR